MKEKTETRYFFQGGLACPNPRQYHEMTAGEYLDQRLREIGLK